MRLIAAFVLVLSVTSAGAQTAPAAPGQQPAPPDVAAVPDDAAKTPSGLASRLLTPGTGSEKPLATDIVTLHFTGWSADGKMIESSRAGGAPAMFALNRGMLGMRECV